MQLKQFNQSVMLVLGYVLLSSNAFAATITVTNISDSGSGSLRDAIAGAASGDTINFNLPYPSTITLASTLTIGKNLNISGPGVSGLAISGNNSVGVFYINPGVIVNISKLTIENGNAPFGGGIYNNGSLTVADSTVTGNSSTNGGGIYNYFADLILSNVQLTSNSADSGAGIFNGGNLTMSNSTVSGNVASTLYGGGIENLKALTVINSTVSGNSAYAGGGIDSFSFDPVTVSNSTFSGNSATLFGGGINSGGFFSLINSTLSANSGAIGGGIYNVGITSTGALNVKNNIFANNSAGGNCVAGGIFVFSFGHNLSDDGTCPFNATGDLNNTPAGLDPNGLQSNGGPTRTIALLAASPAVDALTVSPTDYCTLIDGVTPLAADQRGVVRPRDSDATLALMKGRDSPRSLQAWICRVGSREDSV